MSGCLAGEWGGGTFLSLFDRRELPRSTDANSDRRRRADEEEWSETVEEEDFKESS